jgi:hypothetical protein
MTERTTGVMIIGREKQKRPDKNLTEATVPDRSE